MSGLELLEMLARGARTLFRGPGEDESETDRAQNIILGVLVVVVIGAILVMSLLGVLGADGSSAR